MAYDRKINTGLALLVFYLVLCGQNEVMAQVAKEMNKIDRQSYTVTGDDIRCYKIPNESIDKNEYATYYQLIREKIKERLKQNYRGSYKKGDVNILFTLNFDGSLVRLEVNSDNSTKDRGLVDLAALSVKQASPFPPLPRTLQHSSVSFNVKISFKESL